MFIKICANTNLDDALTAAQLGADAVGFVFAPSKRRVTAEQVAEITEGLPDTVDTVGVFATDDPFEVEHQVVNSGLTTVQLHTPFDEQLVQGLVDEFGGHLQIIQTVSYEVDANDGTASDNRFVAELRDVFQEPQVWAVLIDAAKTGRSGGLGVAFDWGHVAALVERAMASAPEPPRLILAGGLRPDNVAEAVRLFKPWGVDVASGVEASPGKKDWEKMRAFIENARTAATGSTTHRR